MAESQVIEGTSDELASHAHELRGKRLRLTILADETASPENKSDSLVELLSDYIGTCRFGDANLSENTGEKFGALLAQKHRLGAR